MRKLLIMLALAAFPVGAAAVRATPAPSAFQAAMPRAVSAVPRLTAMPSRTPHIVPQATVMPSATRILPRPTTAITRTVVMTSTPVRIVPAQIMPITTHIQVPLISVNGSGVIGMADLFQRASGGTAITVLAFGLQPGNSYVSLYYDNHSCQLEPYSASDVIGGIYIANAGGVGATQGTADDNLDQINSVSVRQAGTFTLLACANVHP